MKKMRSFSSGESLWGASGIEHRHQRLLIAMVFPANAAHVSQMVRRLDGFPVAGDFGVDARQHGRIVMIVSIEILLPAMTPEAAT